MTFNEKAKKIAKHDISGYWSPVFHEEEGLFKIGSKDDIRFIIKHEPNLNDRVQKKFDHCVIAYTLAYEDEGMDIDYEISMLYQGDVISVTYQMDDISEGFIDVALEYDVTNKKLEEIILQLNDEMQNYLKELPQYRLFFLTKNIEINLPNYLRV